MWVLLADTPPFLGLPACQARWVQGRVWITPPWWTMAWTQASASGLSQSLRKAAGSGWATPVEWTMIPLGTMVRPA